MPEYTTLDMFMLAAPAVLLIVGLFVAAIAEAWEEYR